MKMKALFQEKHININKATKEASQLLRPAVMLLHSCPGFTPFLPSSCKYALCKASVF